MKRTRPARLAARTECVTMRMVCPAALIWPKRSSSSSVARESSAPVGSSASRMRGSVIRARATALFCPQPKKPETARTAGRSGSSRGALSPALSPAFLSSDADIPTKRFKARPNPHGGVLARATCKKRTQRLTGADTAVTFASQEPAFHCPEAVGRTRAGSCRSAAGRTPPSCRAGLPVRRR